MIDLIILIILFQRTKKIRWELRWGRVLIWDIISKTLFCNTQMISSIAPASGENNKNKTKTGPQTDMLTFDNGMKTKIGKFVEGNENRKGTKQQTSISCRIYISFSPCSKMQMFAGHLRWQNRPELWIWVCHHEYCSGGWEGC